MQSYFGYYFTYMLACLHITKCLVIHFFFLNVLHKKNSDLQTFFWLLHYEDVCLINYYYFFT